MAFAFSTASMRHPVGATHAGTAATPEAASPGTGDLATLRFWSNMRRTRPLRGLPPSCLFHLIQEEHNSETCQHVIDVIEAALSPDGASLSQDGADPLWDPAPWWGRLCCQTVWDAARSLPPARLHPVGHRQRRVFGL